MVLFQCRGLAISTWGLWEILLVVEHIRLP